MDWWRNAADRAMTLAAEQQAIAAHIQTAAPVTDVAVMERPVEAAPEAVALQRPVGALETDLMEPEAMELYRATCREVGVSSPELQIQEFRHYLHGADLPVFALSEVVPYMDGVAERENPSKLGWEWRPVRKCDGRIKEAFGRASRHDWGGGISGIWEAQRRILMGLDPGPSRSDEPSVTSASDYYAGNAAKVYERTIPLHALQKIAKIEREFGANKVVFMVSDYVVQPHVVIQPDPFLMAVVPNNGLRHGFGRFCIDVWDEPGFGIEQMLKA
jgi:hypothetical protein